MKVAEYDNHIDNVPHYAAVFVLKKCWITEDRQYGRVQPLVGDEVYVEGLGMFDRDSIIHPASNNRYGRPAVSCLKFVGYKQIKDNKIVGDIIKDSVKVKGRTLSCVKLWYDCL